MDNGFIDGKNNSLRNNNNNNNTMGNVESICVSSVVILSSHIEFISKCIITFIAIRMFTRDLFCYIFKIDHFFLMLYVHWNSTAMPINILIIFIWKRNTPKEIKSENLHLSIALAYYVNNKKVLPTKMNNTKTVFFFF